MKEKEQPKIIAPQDNASGNVVGLSGFKTHAGAPASPEEEFTISD